MLVETIKTVLGDDLTEEIEQFEKDEKIIKVVMNDK